LIKFRGKNLIGFGLSELNIDLLKKGKPISIDLKELGMSGKCLIFYGKTESDMEKDLKKFMTDKTKIHKSEKYYNSIEEVENK
jgi:hypothetical protein